MTWFVDVFAKQIFCKIQFIVSEQIPVEGTLVMTIGNHVAEIARQGFWASLTGGWCYEPANSIFCNTVHLYIWSTLLILPLLLGIVGSDVGGGFSTGLFFAYVGFIVLLFFVLKLLVAYLHTVFDTAEPIIVYKTKKSASIEQTCRSPVSSFSARATESNVIEMIDLAAERTRHRQSSNIHGGRGGSLTMVEDGENVLVLNADRSKHVRIDEAMGSAGFSLVEGSDTDFLNELFPPGKMSSIFEDDNSSSTSSKNSTNELLGVSTSGSGKPIRGSGFLLPADSLELLPIARNNRRQPASEGTLRRTISSTRRKYSEPNADSISIKKFNVQRRRSEERPFAMRRVSSTSETRTRSARASSDKENTRRKTSWGPRKAFLKPGSKDDFEDDVAINRANSMEDWLGNVPQTEEASTEPILQTDNEPQEPCCSSSLVNDSKQPEVSTSKRDRQRTKSKSASISECCSDSEPPTHSNASAVVKRHSGTVSSSSSNRKAATALHRTVSSAKVVGDLKGHINKQSLTKFLEELIEKHPEETLDAIENVRMNRLGGNSSLYRPQAVGPMSSAMDRDQQSISGSAVLDNELTRGTRATNLYNLNLGDETHVAYDHEDTSQGAIHSFLDEHGHWWTYSFDEQSSGTAQALGSSRAINEMFNRRRSSGNSAKSSGNSSVSNQRNQGSNPRVVRRSGLKVPDDQLAAGCSMSVTVKLGHPGKELSGGIPATVTLTTLEADEENTDKVVQDKDDLPSTSQQPTTVNIVVDEQKGTSSALGGKRNLLARIGRISHQRRRSHSSSSSTSDEEGLRSSRYISNAPTRVFHPVGGVSFSPSHHNSPSTAAPLSSSVESGAGGHRRHQSDSGGGSRQFISFMNIASRLYNQASSGGVLYPGLSTSNSTQPANIPSALALVASSSSSNTNQPSFNLLVGPSTNRGRSLNNPETNGNNFPSFDHLRRLGANDSDQMRRENLSQQYSRIFGANDDQLIATMDGQQANAPTTAATPSLSSVSHSVNTMRIFSDLQSRAAANTQNGLRSVPLNRTKIHYYYKLKPFANFYLGEGLKVKLDRLSIGAMFDRNNSVLSGAIDVLLAALVSGLAALLIANNTYADFSLLLFAFVVAASQFSLLKSVQPDAASPVHGFNWLVAYSRPVYFCLFSATILLHDYYPYVLGTTTTSTNTMQEKTEGWHWKPPWLRLYSSTGILFSVKDIFTTGLLMLPLAFAMGILPQVPLTHT